MPKRKRNIKKYMNTRSTMASGVSLSEMFPGYDEESVFLDITDKVRPYTRSINLVVSQNGRVIGNIRMNRRP